MGNFFNDFAGSRPTRNTVIDALRQLVDGCNQKCKAVLEYVPFWRWQPIILRNYQLYGRRFMARHQVVTTDDEIEEAINKAADFADEPRLVSLLYNPQPELDLFIFRMSDGARHIIARENLQGLQNATVQQLSQVELLDEGTGIHWPDLDVSFYVPDLLRSIYGTKKWMAQSKAK